MKKKLVKYFILIFSITTLIILKENVLASFRNDFMTIGKMILKEFVDIFFNIIIGVLFGMDYFYIEIKKEGKWKINWIKLLVMGLPTLYFSSAYFLHICTNQLIRNVIAYPIKVLWKYSISIFPTFQMLLGFLVITSFYKVLSEKVTVGKYQD